MQYYVLHRAFTLEHVYKYLIQNVVDQTDPNTQHLQQQDGLQLTPVAAQVLRIRVCRSTGVLDVLTRDPTYTQLD